MAIINVDDAYILNETGAQVDKTTGIPFKNESLTEAEAAQARANIRAGGSNPNLLDNWYFVGGGSQLGDGVFPINQRGQVSYAGSGYALDRYIVENNVTATLQATGIRVQATALYVGITQRVPVNRIEAGKTYTISAIVDGNLYHATFTANGDGNWFSAFYLDGLDWYIPMRYTSNYWEIKVINSLANIDHIVSAVKLELGTVSTLANDGPPDFWAELEKCMRRFRRIKAEAPYYIFATVLAEAASYTVGMIDLPVPMASKPTISTNGSFRLWTGTGENPVTVSSIGIFDAICPLTNCSRIGIIAYPSVNLTADARYDLQANDNANAYIDLSCES